jgi:FkbM family methyltransferase
MTPRARKPRYLRKFPDLEIACCLDFIAAHHSTNESEFFFVQIGAFDGVTRDPVYELVRKRGWRGVLVEPQVEAFELLKKNYAGQEGLQFFNVAVGPCDGEITFFTDPGGMSESGSLIRRHTVKPGLGRTRPEARRVPCWTLATLLREARAPAAIDLLQIDTEGFDYEIIRSIAFDQLRPPIIRYEHVLLSERDRNACLELLAGQGYRFLLEDGDTTAYLGATTP